jgi:hypothetical protein
MKRIKCILAIVIALAVAGSRPTLAAKIVLLAGNGESEPPCEAKRLKLKEPFYAEPDAQGRLVIAEMAGGQRILRLDQDGNVTLLAGTGRKGKPSNVPQPALEATFDGVHNHAIDRKTGDIYFADTWNAMVRKYDAATGEIVTIAGTGEKGNSGDGGPANRAEFGGIYCVALSPDRARLHLADLHNYVIRTIDLKSGKVSCTAGNGRKGRPKEGGRAIDEPLVDPRAVAEDESGNIYVLERGGNAMRVVRPDGTIRTVVNDSGRKGQNGLGGAASECEMNGPKHIVIGREGSVLIADAENHRILRYRPDQADVVLIAGTGVAGSDGLDGPPDKARLHRPHGVYETSDGTIYLTDSYNDRILKIIP